MGNSYTWTPRTQRSLFWPSQGSFACKETSGRKAFSGIGKPPGVPIHLHSVGAGKPVLSGLRGSNSIIL